jgi:branched-chain amino acid aminotransferase
MQINIDPKITEAISNFKLPEQLGFGQVMGPIMATCQYKNGKWEDLNIVPYAAISLAPSAKVFHYAQEIFEGMKAYKTSKGGPFLFRPEENFLRFNKSAERMAMPHIPKEIFMESIFKIASLSEKIIPRRSGESLYLRPFMIATDETLGVRPSESYLYLVITSPSGSYFSTSSLSVLVDQSSARAFPQGIGFAKTGGNYAASLLSSIKAKNLGITQTLWLDAVHRKYIEELSGMNFFAVINDELHTPILSDTILEGITRKSIIELANFLKISVIERRIDINDLIPQITNGECSEAFACGTAAIITPINYLAFENGERIPLKNPEGKLSMKIREALLAIQEGNSEDIFNWVRKIREMNE